MHCKICFKIGITSLKTAAMRNAINYNIYSMSDKEYANESELERHHPHCEAWWWQHHAVGMRLYIRPWRAREVDGWNKCTKTQGNPGEKTWRSLQNTCDLEEDLLSSKTTTQSIKPVLHRDGLKTTMLISWSGQIHSPDLKPTENLWACLKKPVHSWSPCNQTNP